MKTTLIIPLAIIIAIAGYFLYGKFSSPKVEAPTDTTASNGKLNIDVVCQNALSYMSFADDEAAQEFLVKCKAGEYPEVIEHYKAQMNLGDGAAI